MMKTRNDRPYFAPDWQSRRRVKGIMIASKKLSAERLEEIARINTVPDYENPEITEEQAKKLRLARESHPEWFCAAADNNKDR